MPQPFKRGWLPTPDACILRPQLAAHIGTIASLWTHMELLLGKVTGEIMHVDAFIGMSIYAAIKSEVIRLSIIDNVAERYLNPDLCAEFKKLRERIRRTSDERDTVIHGLWGLPMAELGGNDFFATTDTMILADQRKIVMYVAAVTALVHKGKDFPGDKERIAAAEDQVIPALEYTERDFIAIEDRIKERTREVSEFGAKVAQFHAQQKALGGQTTPS